MLRCITSNTYVALLASQDTDRTTRPLRHHEYRCRRKHGYPATNGQGASRRQWEG
jgi:hypothetical protein